jgi:hypothetical protein
MMRIHPPSDPDFPISEAAVAKVHGYENVVGYFGHWPSFHDMEVIRVSIDRVSDRRPSTSHDLRAEFYVFDLTRSPDDPDRKQALLEILFTEISDLSIKGWSYQNPITGLSLSWDSKLRVAWGGCGHDVSFTCAEATVVRLRELNPFRKSQPDE